MFDFSQGRIKIEEVTREAQINGAALAALAVQFILNGFTGYYHVLIL